MQGLLGKAFSQTIMLEAGWTSYLACFYRSIIASFSQKTKKFDQSIKSFSRVDALEKSESSRPTCFRHPPEDRASRPA